MAFFGLTLCFPHYFIQYLVLRGKQSTPAISHSKKVSQMTKKDSLSNNFPKWHMQVTWKCLVNLLSRLLQLEEKFQFFALSDSKSAEFPLVLIFKDAWYPQFQIVGDSFYFSEVLCLLKIFLEHFPCILRTHITRKTVHPSQFLYKTHTCALMGTLISVFYQQK